MSKQRVAVCLFGVLGRSIRYTHSSIKQHVIDELAKKYSVDVYAFDLDVGDHLVDGRAVKSGEIYKLLPIDYHETKRQKDLDLEIRKRFAGRLSMRYDYSQGAVMNAVRAMHSENSVGDWLAQKHNEYDSVVVCGPDYWLLNPVNLEHVQDTIDDKNIVYTTLANPAEGYTNGFYIGSTQAVVKILQRVPLLDRMLPTNRDYEYILYAAFKESNVKQRNTDTLFFKVRNNGVIARQGKMAGHEFDAAYRKVRSHIDNEAWHRIKCGEVKNVVQN